MAETPKWTEERKQRNAAALALCSVIDDFLFDYGDQYPSETISHLATAWGQLRAWSR